MDNYSLEECMQRGIKYLRGELRGEFFCCISVCMYICLFACFVNFLFTCVQTSQEIHYLVYFVGLFLELLQNVSFANNINSGLGELNIFYLFLIRKLHIVIQILLKSSKPLSIGTANQHQQ